MDSTEELKQVKAELQSTVEQLMNCRGRLDEARASGSADQFRSEAIARVQESARAYDLLHSNLRVIVSIFIAGLGTGLAGYLITNKDMATWVSSTLVGPELFFVLAIVVSSYYQALSYCCHKVDEQSASKDFIDNAQPANLRFQKMFHDIWSEKVKPRIFLLIFSDLVQNVLVAFSLAYIIFWTYHFWGRIPIGFLEWAWISTLALGIVATGVLEKPLKAISSSKLNDRDLRRRSWLFPIALGLFTLWCGVAGLYVHAHPPTSPGHKGKVSKIDLNIGPFTPEVGCETSSNIQTQIVDSVKGLKELIDKGNVIEIRFVGSADVNPLGPRGKHLFGNNIGLAQSRARCVAGWISQQLNNSSLTLPQLRIEDRESKKADAKDGADRMVEITAVYRE